MGLDGSRQHLWARNSPSELDLFQYCLYDTDQGPVEQRAQEVRDSIIENICVYFPLCTSTDRVQTLRCGHVQQNLRPRRSSFPTKFRNAVFWTLYKERTEGCHHQFPRYHYRKVPWTTTGIPEADLLFVELSRLCGGSWGLGHDRQSSSNG